MNRYSTDASPYVFIAGAIVVTIIVTGGTIMNFKKPVDTHETSIAKNNLGTQYWPHGMRLQLKIPDRVEEQ